jgi:hypothetical protein
VLARYKTTGYKIELLYFLPVYWLGRALKNQQVHNPQVIRQW